MSIYGHQIAQVLQEAGLRASSSLATEQMTESDMADAKEKSRLFFEKTSAARSFKHYVVWRAHTIAYANITLARTLCPLMLSIYTTFQQTLLHRFTSFART